MSPQATAGRCTVYLVDDHAVFRAGVTAELASSEAIEVLGGAGTVSEAVAGIVAETPDVVLLDVHMPDGGGPAVLRGVQDAMGGEAPRFLALSVSDAAEDVISVIRGGARGYVTKTISGDELAEAIGRIAEGDAVFSPRLAGFVLDAFAGQPPAPAEASAAAGGPAAGALVAQDPEVESLTPREKEVLRFLARGYTYKEIAEELFISVKTVETHASNVLRKTQQSNRHALSRWAASRRLD
ncbi:response regulator transcription factor [Dietzia sp.]|uniref:response regulator transcription factor n=1 Tax=Dietzia sp. TaxID=1871616 RepID=UPI002FDA2AD0